MRSLLLVAHGSRRKASNEEIKVVAQLLRTRVGEQFSHTEHAFLELAEPSIPEGIEKLIQAGSTQIIILPYFLSAGRHVQEDVPGIVKEMQGDHPDIPMIIAPYLGESDQVIEVLAKISSQMN
ncbi:MAG: CbiX/SirB N-terminal domain-containing protein [Pseudomonadota bacterium]